MQGNFGESLISVAAQVFHGNYVAGLEIRMLRFGDKREIVLPALFSGGVARFGAAFPQEKNAA